MAGNELSQATNRAIRKYVRFFQGAVPDWEGFFDAVYVEMRSDLPTIAYDFYTRGPAIGIGNFLESITEIYPGMFAGTPISKVTIPRNVVTIGAGCFKGCTKLQNCTILCNIKEIPQMMFNGCGQLLKVELPNSVRLISNGAFDGCGEALSIVKNKTGRPIEVQGKPQLEFVKKHMESGGGI